MKGFSLTTTRSIFMIPSLSDESLTAALTSMRRSPSFMGMMTKGTDRVVCIPTLTSWRYLLRLEAELHTYSSSSRSTRTFKNKMRKDGERDDGCATNPRWRPQKKTNNSHQFYRKVHNKDVSPRFFKKWKV